MQIGHGTESGSKRRTPKAVGKRSKTSRNSRKTSNNAKIMENLSEKENEEGKEKIGTSSNVDSEHLHLGLVLLRQDRHLSRWLGGLKRPRSTQKGLETAAGNLEKPALKASFKGAMNHPTTMFT